MVVKDFTPRVMPGSEHAEAASPLLASQHYSVIPSSATGGLAPADGSWILVGDQNKPPKVLGWIPAKNADGTPTFTVDTGDRVIAAPAPAFDLRTSVRAAEKHIATELKAMGGVYATYSCRQVSWEDSARGTIGGQLSAIGPNITDVRLAARDGTPLFTVRPPNFNERLGVTTPDQLACVYNNRVDPAVQLTVGDFVRNIGMLGNYAGLDMSTKMAEAVAPGRKMTVRFQTVFLPVATAEQPVEFCASAYNYQTRSADDPKNLLLLCMADGTFVETDGPGNKQLMMHRVSSDDGIMRSCWLSAKASRFAVGDAQRETEAERAAAKAKGESVAMFVGPEAAGARFNMFMTVQLPLKQKPRPTRSYFTKGLTKGIPSKPTKEAFFGGVPEKAMFSPGYTLDDELEGCDVRACCASASAGGGGGARGGIGKSTAARVSIGSEHKVFRGVKKSKPEPDMMQYPTATIVIYHTVEGGVPSPADVRAAIDDMEKLLASCNGTDLASLPFAKSELTVAQLSAIRKKILEDPPGARLKKAPIPLARMATMADEAW
jgi:huntingtin